MAIQAKAPAAEGTQAAAPATAQSILVVVSGA
jgi:hypothetical protein